MQLVIAEKPSVAQSIAGVIGANERKDGYMEGNGYIVSWCVGHLVELAQPDAYFDTWKKWSYESLPMIPEQWKHEVKKDTAAQYRVLKELMHEAKVDSVVCATDAGREGELIFRLVYEMAGCNKSRKRLWISSMEESAIREGFAELKPGSDYDHLYESALCRQQADWLVGLNGTRLFTVLYGGKVLKVGRVQTPTLAMLVDRETKIMNFKKEAYYMAHIIGGGVDAVTDKINSKAEAENVANICAGGQALVTSVLKEEKSVAPPKLYDLTTLQRDANRLFGFTAKQTLEYTQSLYEKKLCTYPRTDSQYLSDDMEQTAKSVIDAIFAYILFEQNIIFHPDIKRVLNSKKVTDHHAIIPTMEITRADLTALPETEMKILSLCANRLLCATGEKHIYNTTKAELRCGDITFKVSGKEVVRNGWKDFEDAFKRSYKTTCLLYTSYGEAPGSGSGGGNAIPPDSYDDATVQALMEEAAKYLGYPYVWGGSSPSTSFDCSGFVCWVFTNSGVHDLPRTTAQGIYDQCIPVSATDAKAGDIIFFTGTYNSPGPVSHVGIYCGNGVMIHCGDPIKYANINTSYWQSHFYSFGRLN